MRAILAIALFMLGAAAVAFWIDHRQKAELAAIDSYEECASAGYPVELTVPGKCRTPDGRVFVQNADLPPIQP